MPQQPNNWIEEFAEYFKGNIDDTSHLHINTVYVKKFIHKVSEQAYAQGKKDVIEGKREELAELEHDQWIAWSKNIAETEPSISVARLGRWKDLWKPYSELTETEKDQDREWADKVIKILSLKDSKAEKI